MTVGKRIRAAREEKKLTQKQLGEMLGVKQQMIGVYENGHRIPKPQTIEKIADALGVSAAWLQFGGVVLVHKDKEVQELFDSMYNSEGEELLEKWDELSKYFPDTDISDLPIKTTPKDAIMGYYIQLNEEGQKKATEYVKDLAQIKEYRKPDDECPF